MNAIDELRRLTAFTLAIILEPQLRTEHDTTFCDVSDDLDGTLRRIDETLGPWREHLPVGLYSAMRTLGYAL
jgi:hypothetical protein